MWCACSGPPRIVRIHGRGEHLPVDVGPRSRLTDWTAALTDDELAEYQATRNGTSIDGLPGLD
jgi:hypothetical protein